MKDIFVVRHGEDISDELTDMGVNQITNLGNKIKLIVGDRPVCIISSEEPRAVKSAEILKGMLNHQLSIQEVDYLMNNRQQSYLSLMELVDSRKEEAGIVIAHKPFVESLPACLISKYGYNQDGDNQEIENSAGYHLDRSKRTIMFISGD